MNSADDKPYEAYQCLHPDSNRNGWATWEGWSYSHTLAYNICSPNKTQTPLTMSRIRWFIQRSISRAEVSVPCILLLAFCYVESRDLPRKPTLKASRNSLRWRPNKKAYVEGLPRKLTLKAYHNTNTYTCTSNQHERSLSGLLHTFLSDSKGKGWETHHCNV